MNETPTTPPPAGDSASTAQIATTPPEAVATANSPLPTEPVAAPAPALPERYDFALEGLAIDPRLVEAADPVLRDLGLSNDAANKLLPLARSVMARTEEALLTQLNDAAQTQKKAWHDAFVADPEIGGAKRGESEHLAARGLDALGFVTGHPFREALAVSGFGNHPDMIRAFRRLGELVSEDGAFVRPGAVPAASRPVWERLYPNEAR